MKKSGYNCLIILGLEFQFEMLTSALWNALPGNLTGAGTCAATYLSGRESGLVTSQPELFGEAARVTVVVE